MRPRIADGASGSAPVPALLWEEITVIRMAPELRRRDLAVSGFKMNPELMPRRTLLYSVFGILLALFDCLFWGMSAIYIAMLEASVRR